MAAPPLDCQATMAGGPTLFALPQHRPVVIIRSLLTGTAKTIQINVATQQTMDPSNKYGGYYYRVTYVGQSSTSRIYADGTVTNGAGNTVLPPTSPLHRECQNIVWFFQGCACGIFIIMIYKAKKCD